jgi:hypothetical protein
MTWVVVRCMGIVPQVYVILWRLGSCALQRWRFFRRTYGSQTVEKREAASPPDSAEPTTGSVGEKYL